jgi:two-component system chemotaxis response regulator CheB
MIAVGGSAGALEVLLSIVKRLPHRIPAAVFVVLHTSPQSNGCLPQILERSGSLPARYPGPAEKIEHGAIYVAPPNQHLIVAGDSVVSVDGPKENGFRPAVDPLFRSLARSYASRAVGVVLSGALDDGTFGLMSIKQEGGLAIVLHPYEALVPSMPLSAIQNVEVDHIVRGEEIAKLLTEAAGDGAAGLLVRAAPAEPSQAERDISLAAVPPDELNGPPSHLTCPECGGTLWQIEQGHRFRFRCHTGHGFTPQALLFEQNAQLETALWSAVRTFQERAALHRQLSHKAEEREMTSVAETYQNKALEEEAKADTIRRLLVPHPAEAELPPAG